MELEEAPAMFEAVLGALLLIIFVSLVTRFLSGVGFSDSVPNAPRRPQMIPRWFPFLGNWVELTFKRNKFLQATRDATLNTIFTVTSLGSKYNVIYSPSHRRQVNDYVILDDPASTPEKMAIASGVSDYAELEKRGILKEVTSSFQKHFIDPPLRKQMVSRMRKSLQTTLPQFVSFLTSLVDQSAWERGSVVVNKPVDGEDAAHVDLQTFGSKFLTHAVTPTITGSAFLEVYPNLLSNYYSFEFAFNLMSLGLPRWLPIPRLTTAHIARKTILDKLEYFHRALKLNFSSSSTGFISTGEWGEMTDVSPALMDTFAIYEEHNLPLHTRAALDLTNLSTINLGINEICTKALIRILAAPNLADELRSETSPYARATQPTSTLGISEPPQLTLDLKGLARECPLLRSSIVETIRLDTFPETSGRLKQNVKLTAPGQAPYILEKDDRILLAPGLYFTDAATYPRPEVWDPSRFVAEPGRAQEVEEFWEAGRGYPMSDHIKEPSYMFQQCLAFLAGVLALWDIELFQESKKKQMKPGLEIGKVLARVTRRKLKAEKT